MPRKSTSPKEECSVLPCSQHTQGDWERFLGLDISSQPGGACRYSVFLQRIGCPCGGPRFPEKRTNVKIKQNCK